MTKEPGRHAQHPWPTRFNAERGRYEVLINARWVSRSRASQLMRRMEGLCIQCGKCLSLTVLCYHCAKAKGRRKRGRRIGANGQAPKPTLAYRNLLPHVNTDQRSIDHERATK